MSVSPGESVRVIPNLPLAPLGLDKRPDSAASVEGFQEAAAKSLTAACGNPAARAACPAERPAYQRVARRATRARIPVLHGHGNRRADQGRPRPAPRLVHHRRRHPRLRRGRRLGSYPAARKTGRLRGLGSPCSSRVIDWSGAADCFPLCRSGISRKRKPLKRRQPGWSLRGTSPWYCRRSAITRRGFCRRWTRWMPRRGSPKARRRLTWSNWSPASSRRAHWRTAQRPWRGTPRSSRLRSSCSFAWKG